MNMICSWSKLFDESVIILIQQYCMQLILRDLYQIYLKLFMGYSHSTNTSVSNQHSVQLQNKNKPKSAAAENINLKLQNYKTTGMTQTLNMPQTNIYQQVENPNKSNSLNQLHPKQNQSISLHSGFLFINAILLAGATSLVIPIIMFDKNSALKWMIIYMGLPTLMFIYLIYLISASKQLGIINYIQTVSPLTNFQIQYNKNRAMVGNFHLSVRCYSQGFDSEDDPIEITSFNYDEIVSTLTTQDISGDIDLNTVKNSHFIVHFIVKHIFGDERSKINLDTYYSKFCVQNNRDIQQEAKCVYQLPQLKYSQTFSTSDCFCSYRSLYGLFTVLGFGWPYIKWVHSRFQTFTVTITKRVTV